MRKIISFCLAAVLAVGISYSTSRCGNGLSDGAASHIMNLLPGDTDLAVKVKSLKAICRYPGDGNNAAVRRLSDDLKFSPDTEYLRASGFDTGKEAVLFVRDWTVVERDGVPDLSVLALMPVTDLEKAAGAVKDAVRKRWPTVRFTETVAATFFEVPGGSVTGCILDHRGWLCVGINPGGSVDAAVRAFSEMGTPLGHTPAYRDVAAKINTGEDIFVFLNCKKIAEKNMRRLGRTDAAGGITPDFPEGYESAGLTADLSLSDLVISGVLNMAPESLLLSLTAGLRFDKEVITGVDAPPVALFSSSVNPGAYYQAALARMSETERRNFENYRKELEAQWGIRLEKDIVENMTGSVNFGIYDSASISMTNHNMVVAIGVKDAAGAQAALEKAVASAQARPGVVVQKISVGGTDAFGINLFGMFQLYAGIRDRHLILSSGRLMFERAVSADRGAGFLSKVRDPALADGLKDDRGILFVDVKEASAVIRTFSFLIRNLNGGDPPDENLLQDLKPFEYLLIRHRVKGRTLFGEFRLKTAFTGPFFLEIQRHFEQLNQADAAN
ncbi:hypothetical protein DENIS_3030 [Desulfonema ishimotonii]|uniref:DUF3352 domain-containing protein n=1 Tax=Desulfonema ishimotonii TaxID=45657 RepID=A0A401FYN0_9BACT|nr:hypothetical protein [Desulfonema ishimotonii]GBC62067.1 hypothetical protein DENIS_3030 [Desulfonema ishimotonii]